MQGPVEAPLQLGERGQTGEQGVMGGRVGRRVPQGRTGGGQGGDAAGGIKEDRPQDRRPARAAGFGEANLLLEAPGSAGMDLTGGDGILLRSQGSLLE